MAKARSQFILSAVEPAFQSGLVGVKNCGNGIASRAGRFFWRVNSLSINLLGAARS